MARKQNRRARQTPESQQELHWSLRVLHRIWLILFTALKVAAGAIATVLLIVVVCGFVFVGILGNYLQEEILPKAEFVLDNYDLDATSYAYYTDANGNYQILQQIYTTTNRQWVDFEDIPKDLIHAAVAIEDKRFFEHQGVDWITTSKACINMFFGGSSTFGGSTITQQLIKNLTSEDSVTVQRKVMEIFRAQQFERRYTKDVILEWYLNTIFLGEGCYGVKSAAATYFGKELQNLTAAECASLISITNNPSRYDPYINQERNRKRQEDTLHEMYTQGWLSADEYHDAVSQTMVFKRGISLEDRLAYCPNTACGYEGTVGTLVQQDSAYYCPKCNTEIKIEANASREVYSWFTDTLLEDVAKDLAKKDGVEWDGLDEGTKNNYMELIRRGGYHIYSTFDMQAQNALDAIYTNLDEIPQTRGGQQLQSSMVILDNRTGDIIAISGGVGEKNVFDAYNRATDATLQTGSSMKPLTVYAPAFELGAITPASVVKDMPLYYNEEKPFPRNNDRTYAYSYTVLDAVMASVNAPAVNTLDMIGTRYSYNFASGIFGLSTLTDHYVTPDGKVKSDVDYSPLALGALTRGATVRDMAAAFATFRNNGVYREARTYTKVYDSKGNLVLDNTQDSWQALSEKSVNYMNYCLDWAVEVGTGMGADMPNLSVAGKSGTTTDEKDRWFCGFTGYYTAVVWTGFDQPESIILTGADTTNPATRLWRKVMLPLHEGKADIPLYSKEGMVQVSVCLDSGKLATDACTHDVRGMNRIKKVWVYREDAPAETCDKHIDVDYCVSGNGVANAYCKKFADVGAILLEKRGLVKTTQKELETLRQAGSNGLSKNFLLDSYIYLVDETGKPTAFHGFDGTLNPLGSDCCQVCTSHTRATWEAYQALNPGVGPTAPTPPTAPTEDDKPDWPWDWDFGRN